MEKINYGIDKSVINNIVIMKFDEEKLNNMQFSKIYGNTSISFENDDIKYLKIDDKHLNFILKAGIDAINKNKYCKIDLPINSSKIKHNAVPLKCKDYFKRLYLIQNHLLNVYGLTVDIQKATFQKLEINTNMILNNDISMYKRIINNMIKIADIRNGKCDKIGSALLAENTVYKQNDVMCLKAYNKTVQVRNDYKLIIADNMLRIEYTFKNRNIITKEFATSYIFDLTDKKIKECIQDKFHKNVVIPYEKMKKDSQKLVDSLYIKYNYEGNKSWIFQVMEEFLANEIKFNNNMTNGRTDQILLLDIEQLYPKIKKVYDANNNRNSGRTISRLKQKHKNNGIYDSYYYQNVKAYEIFENVSNL